MSVSMAAKEALRDELVRRIEQERDTLAAAQKATTEGVTHEDARPEGDKDTRATEASYLARGQAKRVDQLTADAERVRALRVRAFTAGDKITLSAVVQIADEEGEPKGLVFLAPAGGGVRVDVEGVSVQVITPQSPLGKALVGASVGDFVEVDRAGQIDEREVVSVT